MRVLSIQFLAAVFVLIACGNQTASDNSEPLPDSLLNKQDTLPPPFATKSVRNSPRVVGWSDGAKPTAPAGFVVTEFARDLKEPRWAYVADNGDVFVSESQEGRILLFRDKNKDGVPESKHVYLDDQNRPFGMLIIGNKFYIANTDALLEFPYDANAVEIKSGGKKLVSLPAGGYNNHWTRNIITNAAKDKIYISVGSGSNVAEHGMDKEVRRACILEVNLDGSGEKIYGSGLRNPVGMDWAPGTNVLWTAVNERDGLGDDLVPDYMTSVKEGGFYGWPYSYFGQNPDPRMKDEMREDLVKKAIVPEVPLGSHTASLGLVFYSGRMFPEKYRNGAFIGQHGSWNRSKLSGYKVVFVPFNNGKPSGPAEDFLTGFIADEKRVYGRPVCTAVLADGSLLVTDDDANVIWRVSYK
jgi:glucose/arabinose dehydrogenase